MTTSSGVSATPARTSRFSLDKRLSLDTWAVSAAVIFIVLVVAGVFPRVPW